MRPIPPRRVTAERTVLAAHERGVFREIDAFGALVVFRVYNCRGELVERVELSPAWHVAEIEATLIARLDRLCPSHPHDCPNQSGAQGALRLV